MVLGGEEAIFCETLWRIGGNGFSAVGNMAVNLIGLEVGTERRLVRSKPWQNGVGTADSYWPVSDSNGLRLGVDAAVDVRGSFSIQHT